MRVDTGFADVSGTGLRPQLTGLGHSLVPIYDFTPATHMWNAQFEVLTQQFRIMGMIRGFGKSALPDTKSSRRHYDLRELLKHRRIVRVDLTALSLGGMIAIERWRLVVVAFRNSMQCATT